jgi:hypothetical protein
MARPEAGASEARSASRGPPCDWSKVGEAWTGFGEAGNSPIVHALLTLTLPSLGSLTLRSLSLSLSRHTTNPARTAKRPALDRQHVRATPVAAIYSALLIGPTTDDYPGRNIQLWYPLCLAWGAL